ncbi:hypothetical protein BHYA_0087g00120 [Botrytis hyacinthi]|uniref:Uncharacterized protein n=1 Tax=Botrytis hyacinthi TaxID=278943 RepID=A0A4Z1GLQ9_9HELO|nr:hypothetical protein BHYA_0087g00120 [Botrytis hyacinthi]
MSSVFHPYDAALRGTRIPKPSDPPGQDQNQDQDQAEEEKKNKKGKEIQNKKAWEQIKTQVDTLGYLEKRIRKEVEMNLKEVRRKLNGVEGIVGIMESLCRCMLGEKLEVRGEDEGENEGEDEDEDEEEEEMDDDMRARRRSWRDEDEDEEEEEEEKMYEEDMDDDMRARRWRRQRRQRQEIQEAERD